MEILNEKEETFCIMEIDFSENEYAHILAYAKENITEEEHNALLLEWGMITIIKETLKRNEPV